ncbi:nucleoside monophosphate kinase [Candidatus Parcubacteria bacterium]|nr:nucleoside monophosphate kinase [Candidatus Parcubacteria bacterium]
MNKPFNFTFIGRSGSGKGTQAKLLMKHFGNLFYVSTGDLFRDLSKADTDTSIRIQKILKQGGLPFDDLSSTLWMHELAYNLKENEGFILDGAPRRVNEAQTLDRFLDFLERKETTFNLLVDISREEAFNRLSKRRLCKKCGRLIPWVGEFKELKVCDKCGGELITRADDSPEAIKSRLDYYEERVVPTVKYYEEQSRLLKINGEQSIEDVFKDILKALK